MFDLTIASKERHDRFIQRVVASRKVWGLKSADGWAVSTSTSAGHAGWKIMPFWSDRAYARQCAKKDWAHYEATPIPLEQFFDRWLAGMSADDCLVGTNWNSQLCGHEIHPTDLKRELKSQHENMAK
jgi:hypothetical protein